MKTCNLRVAVTRSGFFLTLIHTALLGFASLAIGQADATGAHRTFIPEHHEISPFSGIFADDVRACAGLPGMAR